MNPDQLLGLDSNSPSMRRAQALADADRALLRDLIHIRKERGLTQTEVGEILGISQASVAAFEAHDSNPTLATIRRYAHAVEALVSHEVTKDTSEPRSPRSTSARATRRSPNPSGRISSSGSR